MERALQKLASQLNQYDSASLAALWESYAQKVAHFEPTKRWEESVLVFCMIQSMHWKNQLFNAGLLADKERGEQSGHTGQEMKDKLTSYGMMGKEDAQSKPEAEKSGSSGEQKQRRKVLLFVPRNSGQS